MAKLKKNGGSSNVQNLVLDNINNWDNNGVVLLYLFVQYICHRRALWLKQEGGASVGKRLSRFLFRGRVNDLGGEGVNG